MWAISSAVSVMVVAMVNFIQMMRFWLGSIVMVLGLFFSKGFGEIVYFLRIAYWHLDGIGSDTRLYRELVKLRKAIRLFIVSEIFTLMNLIDEKLHERIIAKKMRLDEHRPLSEEIVKRLRLKMEIEYTYHSNAIEGNKLTYRETQLVIREGMTIGGKSVRDHLEAINHPHAMEYIETLKDRPLTESDILRVHEMIFSGILENAGNYRNSQVFIEGSDFVSPPAFEVPSLMKKLVEWVERNPNELRPIELAAVFHYKLVAVHPFDDGNGRVARLLMNLLLIKHGYPFTTIRTYDRRRYYGTLEKADNDYLKPFVNFVARCAEESLDLYLSAIEPTNKNRQLIKLSKAAELVPYSQEYLSLLARRGKLAATKIGKDWYVTPEALKNYLMSVKSRKTSKKQRT